MPDDRTVLEQLNRDYIASVQNSDVRRFDEILAEEFYCSNPDGSLVDRREFLLQTARPVTISGLEANDVKIRLLATSRSSMHAPPTRRPTDRPKPAAIPMSGRAGMANGEQYPRT